MYKRIININIKGSAEFSNHGMNQQEKTPTARVFLMPKSVILGSCLRKLGY